MSSPEGKTIATRVILGILGVFLIAIGLGVGTYKYVNKTNAPVEAVETTATTPAPTPTATVEQPQADPQQLEAPDAQETRDNLEKFRSSPDPHPPVSVDKIKGVWWSEDKDEHKAYAFVEDEKRSEDPLRVTLSMKNGASLVVECSGQHPPLHHGGGDFNWKVCHLLPIFSWVRVGLTNVDRNPDTSGWGMTYRDNDDSVISDFIVKTICYPNGYCTTFEEEGDKLMKKMREKGFTGSD